MSADCFVPAVTTLLFFAQNTAFRSHLLTQKGYHSLPSSVNGTDCQEFKIAITFFKFGLILRTWPFFLLTEGAADAQQCRKPAHFFSQEKNWSDFRSHHNFRDYSYILTFSAPTLLTCSLSVSLFHNRLVLEQSCSSSSLLLSLFYLARI